MVNWTVYKNGLFIILSYEDVDFSLNFFIDTYEQ